MTAGSEPSPSQEALATPLLPRQRLVNAVLATPPGSLCVISGVAGTGRSTLLRLVAAQSPQPCRLVDAAQLEATTADDPRSLDRLLDADGHLRVLVDDIDPVGQAELLDRLLAATERRDTATVVLTPRAPRPARLLSLATSGRLVHIDAPDLRLTPEEAYWLVAARAPWLPAQRREQPVLAAQGWVAALVLPLLNVSDDSGDDPVEWLNDRGVDLLTEPAVANLGEPATELLVRCSILRTLTPEACDAVLGSTGSAEVLAELARTTSLLRQADRHRAGYDLHPLLAEGLRRRLASRGDQALAEAHLAAGRHYAATGEVEQAIDHLTAGQAVAEALELLEAQVGPLLDLGRSPDVARWYGALGPGVTGNVLHLLGVAWSNLLQANVEPAENAVVQLEELLRLAVSDTGRTPEAGQGRNMGTVSWQAATLEHLRAVITTWRGYPARAQRHADEALRLYGDALESVGEQTLVLLASHIHLWRGDTVAARRSLAPLQDRLLHQVIRRYALTALRASIAAQEGRAHRAVRLAEQALAVAGEYGPRERFDAMAARAQGMLDLNDLEAASAAAKDALALADRHDHVTYQVLARLAVAGVLAAEGDPGGALSRVSQARDLIRQLAPASDLMLPLIRVETRLRLDVNDAVRADRLIRQLPGGLARQLLQVRLVQLRRPGSGVTELLGMRPSAPREAVEVRVLLANARHATRPRDAETHLVAAAELADEVGLRRALASADKGLLAFADRVARRGGHDSLATLVAVAEDTRSGPARSMSGRLSAGELELLALLPGRRSNEELAQELSVSVNTVKTRLQRLYRKLDVHTRAEAVAQARSMRLTPPAE